MPNAHPAEPVSESIVVAEVAATPSRKNTKFNVTFARKKGKTQLTKSPHPHGLFNIENFV
jgi:hypothetical protein